MLWVSVAWVRGEKPFYRAPHAAAADDDGGTFLNDPLRGYYAFAGFRSDDSDRRGYGVLAELYLLCRTVVGNDGTDEGMLRHRGYSAGMREQLVNGCRIPEHANFSTA